MHGIKITSYSQAHNMPIERAKCSSVWGLRIQSVIIILSFSTQCHSHLLHAVFTECRMFKVQCQCTIQWKTVFIPNLIKISQLVLKVLIVGSMHVCMCGEACIHTYETVSSLAYVYHFLGQKLG